MDVPLSIQMNTQMNTQGKVPWQTGKGV